MYFISEEERMRSIYAEESINHQLYSLSLEHDDYFLNYHASWDMITTDLYQFKVSDRAVSVVPSGFYLMVADIYGALDWILIDEAIGRPVDALVISKDMKSWSLCPLDLVGCEVGTIYWPMTKNAIPVSQSAAGDNIFILSKSDQYSATKDRSVDMVVV